jgi:exonuclease III
MLVLDAGFVDVFRRDHPDEPGHYTYWSFMHNARAKNIGPVLLTHTYAQGWRLDYFVASGNHTSCIPDAPSESCARNVKSVEHRSDVLGSDHCPLVAVMKLK